MLGVVGPPLQHNLKILFDPNVTNQHLIYRCFVPNLAEQPLELCSQLYMEKVSYKRKQYSFHINLVS